MSGGDQLCDELMDIFKSMQVADEQSKKLLAERIQDLDTNVKTLVTEANIMLKNPPLQNKLQVCLCPCNDNFEQKCRHRNKMGIRGKEN